MTAIILAFPDIHERNDREFDRTGSTSYTRAVDESHELGGMPTDISLDRPAYLQRVDALNVVVGGLPGGTRSTVFYLSSCIVAGWSMSLSATRHASSTD